MKHVLITGGSSGIGSALVEQFLLAGYEVTLTYNKTKPSFDFLKGACNCIKADLNKHVDVLKLFDVIASRPIDVLINNAALSIKTPFLDISDQELRRVIEVNIVSAFKITQKVFEMMATCGGGRIINIGSIGGQIGGRDQIHYAISKGALETLTKSIARIGFECNVFAFNVSPGCVDTPMLNANNTDLSILDSQIPFGNVAQPTGIAKMILSLCADHWNYASGQTISYNGGLLL